MSGKLRPPWGGRPRALGADPDAAASGIPGELFLARAAPPPLSPGEKRPRRRRHVGTMADGPSIGIPADASAADDGALSSGMPAGGGIPFLLPRSTPSAGSRVRAGLTIRTSR
ncbi:hypothetical protein MTO96_009729 [Rhipicephalus appendiculatus]